MGWKRYLVHLPVPCLVGSAAAFAHPFAATVHERATYRDVQAEDRPSAGAASVQQQAVQLEAEMREMKRAYRGLRAADLVAQRHVHTARLRSRVAALYGEVAGDKFLSRR